MVIFCGTTLRSDLDTVIKDVIKNASRTAPAASAKEVESFNSMFATKAPRDVTILGQTVFT